MTNSILARNRRRTLSGTASRFWGTAALALTLLSAARAQDVPPLAAGTRAPQFVTTTLDGKPLSLRSLRGRVVLLDFWASWCGPCRMSTPTLQSLHQKFAKKGLRVVGLSLDDKDSRADIAPYKQKYGVTYTLAYAPQANFKTAMDYHTNMDPDHPKDKIDHPVPPSVFLIDRKGIVRWSQIGYSLDEEQILTKLIKKYVAM